MVDRPFDGVFHRRDPIMAGPFFHIEKEIPDRRLGNQGNAPAEILQGRDVGKGGRRLLSRFCRQISLCLWRGVCDT